MIRRRWRILRNVLIVGIVLAGVASCWLLSDGTVPRVHEVFPDGGEWIQVDIPRGHLDREMEALVEASWRHLSLAGSTLGHSPLPEPRGIGFALRTRPWRLAVWRGAGRGTIVVVAAQGLFNVTSRMNIEEPRSIHVGGRTLWASLGSGVLVVSDEESLVESTRVAIESAQRDVIGDEFELVMATPTGESDQPGGVTEVVPVPEGTTSIVGTMAATGDDQWRFLYSLRGEKDPGPWGPEAWKDLVERENIVVELVQSCGLSAEGTTWTGEWRLSGVARAFERLRNRIEHWNER